MSAESVVATPTGGFSEEALLEYLRTSDEPDWLRRLRLDAFTVAEAMPMPSRRDEEWRRTDLSMLDLASVVPFRESLPPASAELGPHELQSLSRTDGEQAGLLYHLNAGLVHRRLAEDLAAKGVILIGLSEAADEYPELVQRYLFSQVGAADGKFQALHAAFWNAGTFVYVPRDVEVRMPLRSLTRVDSAGTAASPHTLVVVEAGASLDFVDEYTSGDQRGQLFANSVVELIVGAGARLRYNSLQRWGNSAYAFSTQKAAIGRDAELSTLSVVLGSRMTKSWIASSLNEPGASTRMVGIMFADGRQRFHHHTLQDHRAPSTTSDLLFKAALRDEARSEYSGMIKVHKDAQKTDAYQANRNLVLSEHARADSMPKLEIEANDVRCTHGATAGPIDEEQVFYLQARGLPRPEAERMIVEGFFEDVAKKIPVPEVRETVREAVAAKLSK